MSNSKNKWSTRPVYLKGHDRPVTSTVWNRDGDLLFTGITLVSFTLCSSSSSYRSFLLLPLLLRSAPHSHTFAPLGGKDSVACAWYGHNGKRVFTRPVSLRCCCFSPPNANSLPAGERLGTYDGHRGAINDVTVTGILVAPSDAAFSRFSSRVPLQSTRSTL